MSKDEENWQVKLFKEFPYLYRGRELPLTQSLMSFGFECGSGWKDLLRTLSIALMYEIKKIDKLWRIRPYLYKFAEHWNRVMGLQPKFIQKNTIFGRYPRFLFYIDYGFSVVQVKEKYGTLRYYMNHETDDMAKHISQAEELSSRTCETCGKYGKVRGKGWYYVSCNEHAKDIDKDTEDGEDV